MSNLIAIRGMDFSDACEMFCGKWSNPCPVQDSCPYAHAGDTDCLTGEPYFAGEEPHKDCPLVELGVVTSINDPDNNVAVNFEGMTDKIYSEVKS